MSSYEKPKVWQWEHENQDRTGNRPTAGARFEQTLPVGEKGLQIYSLGTPNGIKVTIMLEELREMGIKEAEYDVYKINILKGDQFGSDFVEVNPNSKIPAMVDYSVQPPLRVFESGSIVLYLADKFNLFIPQDLSGRTECLNWLFWQTGAAPFVGGGFGHFFHYAPETLKYPIDRYTMETKRQLDVLDQLLAKRSYICGDDYTIADMVIWSWYGRLLQDRIYPGAAQFLEAEKYPHVLKWTKKIGERPAVQRALNIKYQEI